jgi:hypothetical protein
MQVKDGTTCFPDTEIQTYLTLTVDKTACSLLVGGGGEGPQLVSS